MQNNFSPQIFPLKNIPHKKRQQAIKEICEKFPAASVIDYTYSFFENYERRVLFAHKKRLPESEFKKFLTDDLRKLKVTSDSISRCHLIVYFPLMNSHIIYPPEEILYQVRTASNKGLISEKIQQKLRSTPILVIGLSVGSSIVSTLFTKGAQNLICIDGDTIEPVNLNRLPLGAVAGQSKTSFLSHHLTLLDPYHNCQFLTEKISQQNINKIFEKYLPQIIIDECDDVQVKEFLREEARKRKIPVISAADIGNGCVQIDTEDFSLTPQPNIFHGVRENKNITSEKWNAFSPLEKLAVIVGLENLPPEMLESVARLQKGELPGIPQEISAISLAAAMVTIQVEKILSGEKIVPRKVVRLPELLEDKTNL
jgi:tRNA A37 threonylcarbamoyladenosine dehydratase